MSMYTFNLLSLHSIGNDKSNGSLNLPSKLNIELCSIKKLKEIIGQTLSLQDDSFDIYCQGIQLSEEEKNFNEYQLEQEDQLLIIPKMKQMIESNTNVSSGLPTTSELHQTSKKIEISATPNEFHRLYWLMKTPEFWRRITQVIPEILLDSSALGLCEDSVLFCQNHNPKRLIELVQTNPSLYKVILQVIKEWTLSSSSTTRDVQLSPAAYFLNGSPHLVEPIAPRQPPINVMPRRITNEDFFRALEQTNRASATASSPSARPSTTNSNQPTRSSNRRQMISLDQLRNVLQRTTSSSNPPTPTTTTATTTTTTTMNAPTTGEPTNIQALLDQMRAMGLTDEAANRQALEAANWDLKTALDILLG